MKDKTYDKLPVVGYKILKKIIYDHLYVNGFEKKMLHRCIDTLTEVIQARLMKNQPIIIDNFGTLCRRNTMQWHYSLQEKMFTDTVIDKIWLIPNIKFLSYVQSPYIKEYIRERGIPNLTNYLKTHAECKKVIIR